jgi:tRNA(fMet)-specific endonuclease VapC
MKFLLDTNICIYIIKQKPISVLKKLKRHKISDISISSITLSELEYGIEKSSRPEQNRLALTEFLTPITIIPFDSKAAVFYGKIRQELERKGKIIGPLDLLIASHAVSLNSVLVTNNTKEFERVNNLKLENWT